MANYEHLQLVRLPQSFERRKRGGVAPKIERNTAERRGHSGLIETQLNSAILTQQRRRKPQFVDPSLILRVQMSGGLQEKEWERLGLTVLASDPDKTLVLFSTNEDLEDFRYKLQAYAREKPRGQKSAEFEGFIGAIAAVTSIEPLDRIGLRFRDEGFNNITDFLMDVKTIVDIELWDFGSRDLRELKLRNLSRFIEENDGQILDEYIGASITLLRASVTGDIIRQILEVNEVACVDLPPTPDVLTGEFVNLEIGEIPQPDQLHENAPTIGVIDSGLNLHPLLNGLIVGTISIPEHLGAGDDYGHGTRVAGIAVYGDLRGQLSNGRLIPYAKLCSAKVVNQQGRFDEAKLIPKVMREAVTELVSRFGARIINISLGDVKLPYQGGKVGVWAATLDELARELNIIIIVSAGNRHPRGGLRAEEGVTEYPQYLLEENNKILEPAGAVNVLSVGSISHNSGLNGDLADYVSNIPIAYPFEPSPFTRIGPGVRGMLKPDLVDFGGTMIYDALIGNLRSGNDIPSAGMITLNHLFLEQSLRCGSGTSYSAPMIANKAAYLLTLLPNATANLIRALLVGAAGIPNELENRVGGVLGDQDLKNIYGNGYPSAEKAAYSSDNRVVLYTEDELSKDYFAVYEIPIPQEYQSVNGTKELKVTLAYDPPVRHSRADYMGTTMNFRIVRGKDPDFIFDHYKKRTKADGRAPELPKKYDCSLQPSVTVRDKSTVQTGMVRFQRNIEEYGDRYFLVVRCLSGWADYISSQKFAVVVELSHQADIKLYQRVQQRIRPRIQS